MTKPEKRSTRSDLVMAAEALDAELRRYEGLSEAICKVQLSSQKSLERMTKSLGEVSESEERLGLRLGELVTAIAAVRDRQQAQAESVRARALFLGERAEAWKDLMVKYEALARDAASLNAMLQAIATQGLDQGATAKHLRDADADADAGAGLEEVVARIAQVAASAQAFEEEATAREFFDMAREADSIRQKLLSARNKLSLIHRSE